MPSSDPVLSKMTNYAIAHLADLAPVDCPCGSTRRAFLDDPRQTASVHLLEISEDSQTHYHKEMTEIYLILEGEGHMELDGERIPVSPMTSILIHPGCRHRAVGTLKVAVIPIPAFNPEDEWFD